MLDVELFGLKPGPHHVINVILHATNAVLLFLVLVNMTEAIWCAAFIGGMFALHPLHVESVAWISERKDVLSTFFCLITLAAYVHYVRKPRLNRYLVVIGCFALGLMSKSMLVTLPFVLILLDYWPLQRVSFRHEEAAKWAKLFVEKIPLFLLAGVSAVLTLLAQHQAGAIVPLEDLPFSVRISNALVSYVSYVFRTFWPVNLAVYYPIEKSLPVWEVMGALSLLIGITVVVLKSRIRPVLVGWLWYLGTLIPVIGLVQIGNQSTADRYMYIPIIGLLIIVAWSASQIAFAISASKKTRIVLASAAVTLLTASAAVGAKQLTYWCNSITLFEHALAVTSNNWMAHDQLGKALSDEHKTKEAIAQFAAALRIHPYDSIAMSNLGVEMTINGTPKQGLQYARQAVALKPESAVARNNLAFVLMSNGDPAQAVVEGSEALRLRPSWSEAHVNIGSALLALGKPDEALDHFREAVKQAPNSSDALNNLAWLRATYHDSRYRDRTEALMMAERAAALSQHRAPSVLDTLAAALAENQRFADAANAAIKARDLALLRGDKELASKINERLELYKQGLPYRQ